MHGTPRTLVALATVLLVACSNAASADSDRRASDRAAAVQPANLTRTALRVRGGEELLSAFSVAGTGDNGAEGTIQPGAVEIAGGRIVADRQINVPPNGSYTTTLGNSGHDAPALIRNADGSVFEIYGAASTYAGNHPPASWACLSHEFCEPYKRASAQDVRAGHAVDALANSPEALLPSVGISEVSFANAGDATIIAGQEQPADRNGQAGTQAYVTYHARSQNFDTSDGDGLETISRAPNDDAYFDVALAGGGSGVLHIDADGASCDLHGSGGSAEDVAQSLIANFDRECGSLRGHLHATSVRYDPLLKAAPGTIVGFTLASGDPQRASAPSASCNGFTCVTGRGDNAAHDVRVSGLHRHFLFGGVVASGPYVYYIMDVQQATGTWYGAAHSSYALRLACFRTTAPSGDVWTWTDCAGNHPFTVRPGPLAPDRVTGSPYVVGAPRGGYSGDMTPYVFSNAGAAQTPQGSRTFPVVSAESLTLLPDGRVLIVHGCQNRSGAYTACFALLDGRNAQTLRAGTIDSPSRGSLASIAATTDAHGVAYAALLAGNGAAWGCSGSGPCLLTYRYDALGSRWTRTGTESIPGPATDGFPGTVIAEGDRFVAQVKTAVNGPRAALSTFSRPIP